MRRNRTYTISLAMTALLALSSCVNRYDILIVGGGASGTATAIQAARSDKNAKVLLVEETPWLGGMLTSAGVSATDGCHLLKGGIWSEFRDSLELEYGGRDALFSGWVSNTLFEPYIGARIFANIAAREKNLTVLTETTAEDFARENGRWFATLSDGTRVSARILVDGTELGDVAAAVGVPYDLGIESREETGEAGAGEVAAPIIQDLTYVMTLKDYGRDMTIDEPEGYDKETFAKCCRNAVCPEGPEGLEWNDVDMMAYGKISRGKYMINWPQAGNDYYVNIIEMNREQRDSALREAKLHTLRYLYFLQHELGYSNLGLSDEYPTEDHLPMIPYHRESRRIHGKVRFTLNDISNPYAAPEQLYRTAIAVGDYPVDHHHKAYDALAAAGEVPQRPELEFPSIWAYGVPLGVIYPENHEGLLVIEKSISVSNMVNGTTRLQPVVLQIGQAAGVAAALALRSGGKVSIRQVQDGLIEAGAYILPLADVPADDPAFKAYQRIAATGILRYTGCTENWANRAYLRVGEPLLAHELYVGLADFYGKERVHEIFAEAGINMHGNSPMTGETLAYLAEMIAGVNMEFDNPYAVLTRGEAAVAIDRYMDPFHKFDVDWNGRLITR